MVWLILILTLEEFARMPEQASVLRFSRTCVWHHPPVGMDIDGYEVPGRSPPAKTETEVHEVSLIQKDDEATFVSHPRDTASPIQEQRWSNAGGAFRDYTSFKHHDRGGGPGSNFAIEETLVNAQPVLLTDRRNVMWSFGLGFGQMIKSVKTTTLEAGTRTLDATMRIGPHDNWKCRLEICSAGLVRRARITGENAEMEVTFEISTSGLVESQGFVFAKNGRFKEARRLKRPTGNQPPSMVMEEFSVEFIGFDLLSNEEYAKSVQMDRPTSAYLINRAQGNYSYIDPQGKEKHISTLAAIKERFSPTSSSSNWLWPVVALHALLFAAGAGWYLWHRRRVAVAG